MKSFGIMLILLLGGILAVLGLMSHQQSPVQEPVLTRAVPGHDAGVTAPCRESAREVSGMIRCPTSASLAGEGAAHLKDRPVPQSDQDIQSMGGEIQQLREWAEADPSSAAIWAAEQVNVAFRQEALNQVAFAWAESDLSAALVWAIQLPVDEARNVVLQNLGYELARTDPAKALELAVTLPPEKGRDGLVIHAVSQWADTDAVAATEWACAIPEFALRERVLAAIATVMADQDPELAVTLTTQALWPGRAQDQAAIAIVQRWTQQDPHGAAAWVEQFPAGQLQETALCNLVAMKATP